jgi:hypothetical protein
MIFRDGGSRAADARPALPFAGAASRSGIVGFARRPASVPDMRNRCCHPVR